MHTRQTPEGRGTVHVHSSSQSRGEAGGGSRGDARGQGKAPASSLTEQLLQAAQQQGSHAGAGHGQAAQTGSQSAQATRPQSAQARPQAASASSLTELLLQAAQQGAQASAGHGQSAQSARPQAAQAAQAVRPQATQVAASGASGSRPNLLVPLALIIVLFIGMGTLGKSCGSLGGESTGGFFDTGNYDPYQSASTYQIDSSLGAGDGAETWTVLMYLCGSDLESTSVRQGGGQATNNLVELTKANLGSNVRFVVETGGARSWQNDVVSARYLNRYSVEDGKLALRDQQPSASMAASSTFADFLQWGVDAYPADHYMVVVWDHGGGSISGVCQDELYPYNSKGEADSLTLPEMRDALQKAGVTFDVVGFDTCLMATVETAQILSPYARYMVASEETEPGSGWDYTAWPNWLAAHPGTSGEDLGTVICQTYYNKCAAYRQAGMATLSVIDLAKVGKVSQAFQDASDDIAYATIDTRDLRKLQQGAGKAESFGSSGFTSMNMVDLADLMNKTRDVVGGDASAVVSAIDQAVVYEVHGRNRAGSSGLSVFYPLQISDRKDFQRYADVTDNTPYLQFLAVLFGVYDDYQWNKFENFVPLRGEPVEEKDVKIRFDQSVSQSGHLQLQLTQGAEKVAKVELEMYVYLEPLDTLCYMGSDNDLNGSYDEGWFSDNFQGEWLAIDGHYVSATLAEEGEGYNLYYVPILLNDEQTGIIVEYDFASGEYAVLCAWDDANEATNMAAKTGRLLQEGDTVQFLFPSQNAATGASSVIPLETMSWHDDAEVTYEGVGDGTFAFRYAITDILGNETVTDLVYQRYQNGRVVK